MPKLGINFDNVPDEIEPIPDGIYVMTVTDVPEIEPAASGKGDNVVVSLAVEDEGEFKGRTVRDWIFIGNEIGKIRLKQFARACGIPIGPEGLQTEDLAGATCKVRIKASTYKDKTTGETKQSSRVAEYIVQG